MLYRWQLDAPSFEPGYEDRHEIRRGLDVLHFQDDKIVRKLTYSKTSLDLGGDRVRLAPLPTSPSAARGACGR